MTRCKKIKFYLLGDIQHKQNYNTDYWWQTILNIKYLVHVKPAGARPTIFERVYDDSFGTLDFSATERAALSFGFLPRIWMCVRVCKSV